MIQSLAVQNYRSIRDLTLPLKALTVITGANGSGKSNLYRSLYLLHAAALGRLAPTIAAEGGMPSVLWAGPRRKGSIRLTLEATFDSGLSYSLSCGLPEINDLPSSFRLDPLVKAETASYRTGSERPSVLLDRGRSSAMVRDTTGNPVEFPMTLGQSESALVQLSEPHRFPYLSVLRTTLLNWRFYHGFRTDENSPLRQPQIGVFTPALAHDGRDLAAALQTIIEIGDAEGLFRAVRQGLNGAALEVLCSDRFRVRLQLPGILRPLDAWELSDGTLRYLCLLAALMSPRLPSLLILNEPEASLHTDLLAPLADQIVAASHQTQVWVTTHSRELAAMIERISGVSPTVVRKTDGETIIV
ncbi:MAG: AAA family ATPase [Armatimonadota bacterium]